MAKAPQKPGQRKAKYRASVEAQLYAFGFSGKRIRWDTAPAGLTVSIGEELRTFALHAGQSIAKTERELGKLEVWAEVLSLTPRPAPVATASAAPRKARAKAPIPGQIDLEELIAASHKPNGHVVAAGMSA